jgi:hypothetical protein
VLYDDDNRSSINEQIRNRLKTKLKPPTVWQKISYLYNRSCNHNRNDLHRNRNYNVLRRNRMCIYFLLRMRSLWVLGAVLF